MLESIQEIDHDVYVRPALKEPRPHRTGESAEAFSVTLCETETEFRELCDEWNQLLDHAARKSVFLRHEFLHTWWEIYGRQQRDATPFIMLARDRERRLVGVLPLYRGNSRWPYFGMKQLNFLGSTHEALEYLDVIVADNAATHRIVKAMLAGLAKLSAKYDLVTLIDMDEEALLPAFLPELAAVSGGWLHQRALEVCPYIKISGDFAAYLQTLATKHSGNFRRQLRKLKENHAVTLEIGVEPATAEKDFAVLCELHRQRWAGRGEASAFDNDWSQRFHQRVMKATAENGIVRIFTLKCDGQSVAALYCFLYNNRLIYYQSGIDVAYEKKSVGVSLLGMVLQHCFEQGYSEFDFLRGEEEYKFRWTKTTRRTVAGEIAVSRRAKIYLQSFQALRRLRNRLIHKQDRAAAQNKNA